MWPVFLILAGAARVVCFAMERRPRSPVDGIILMGLGGFFLAIRVSPALHPLQVYGRYWIVALGLFAGAELIRYYSHRPAHGPQPRIFSGWRIAVAALIVITGIAASRAGGDPRVVESLRLPRLSSLPAVGVSKELSTTGAAIIDAGGVDCQQLRRPLVNRGARGREA
jgi:hypothetical protein